MISTKNDQISFYILINQTRETETNSSENRSELAEGNMFFDTSAPTRILDPNLSKFYKAMDLAG